jgi:hypothetical protein
MYILRRQHFLKKYGDDPCLRRLKVLSNMHDVDILVREATSIRTKGRKLLKQIYPMDVSF